MRKYRWQQAQVYEPISARHSLHNTTLSFPTQEGNCQYLQGASVDTTLSWNVIMVITLQPLFTPQTEYFYS